MKDLTPDFHQLRDVKLEFIQPGKPMQNGFIERLNRSYREAVLDMYVFKTLCNPPLKSVHA